MLIIYVLLAAALVVIITAVWSKDSTDTGFAAILSGLAGFFIFAIGGLAISEGRDAEAGWSAVDERTYTLAEGSEIEMVGARIDIVAEIDGSLRPITLEAIRKVDFPGESSRTTVVVQEEFRDVGTAIFPWGEGESRTVVSVR